MTKQIKIIFGAAAGIYLGLTAFQLSAAQTQHNISGQQSLGAIEKAQQIIGSQIKDKQNQIVGKVSDLVVDLESGRVLYAVATITGGQTAVPPQLFSAPANSKSLTLNTDKQ